MITRRNLNNTSPTSDSKPLILSPRVLAGLPLPQPDEGGDKEERGRVLVVGGAPEMPGAIILAATAALRAGAGKLQIATCRSVAHLVALAVPEALVMSLPETKSGCLAASAIRQISEKADQASALLIGPGMVDEQASARFTQNLLAEVERPTLILDAAALALLAAKPESLTKRRGRVILTPHAGEMARLTGLSKSSVTNDPWRALHRAVKEFNAVVALKGRETLIAAPGSETYCNRAGNVGLATSGSGDTLSGVIAGLAARGATPLQAAVWGVYLHARAGDALAQRIGPLGFLARELLAEVLALMAQLTKTKKR